MCSPLPWPTITMRAMQRGLNVYTQKPLTQTIHEARALTRVRARPVWDDRLPTTDDSPSAFTSFQVIFKFPPIPESRGFNELPYRMLTPEGLDNLLVAGRCASMTHDGQSAARVSGACFAMGEAAGTAASLALSGNTIPRDIAVEKLQQTLKQQGAFIGREQSVPKGL